MIVRKIFYGAVGATALAAAMLAATPSAEARCERNSYTGRATGLLRATAGIAARVDWRNEVRRYAGPEFAWWSKAKRRVTSCNKPESGRWSCRARAVPCDG